MSSDNPRGIIELGNINIKCLIFRINDDNTSEVLSTSIIRSEGIHNGVIVNFTKASNTIRSCISAAEKKAKILIMGDFNDDPTSNSIHHLVQQDFYNPMENLLTIYDGSLSHRGRWNLFDQIILSNNFHRFSRGSHNFMKADIFDHPDLKVYHGRYKGLPFRTYAGDDYKGGVSDHFPVYVLLKYNLG